MGGERENSADQMRLPPQVVALGRIQATASSHASTRFRGAGNGHQSSATATNKTAKASRITQLAVSPYRRNLPFSAIAVDRAPKLRIFP